jgi:O6-methylguanine-DNA--protein-cysteine methyltransferase
MIDYSTPIGLLTPAGDFAVAIPCHRVVRNDGRLSDYR